MNTEHKLWCKSFNIEKQQFFYEWHVSKGTEEN